jgi:hypothetical protein
MVSLTSFPVLENGDKILTILLYEGRTLTQKYVPKTEMEQ